MCAPAHSQQSSKVRGVHCVWMASRSVDFPNTFDHFMRSALPRSFYQQPTLQVARQLIGQHLIHKTAAGIRIGRIVETEAYQGPKDLAAHSSRGRTARTEVMFGPAGHAYVYLIYGFWNCLNVVTADHGVPHAVLIRALEPISGIDDTTHGPGLLCRALGIDRRLNGVDLITSDLWIEQPERYRQPKIARSTRIGVDYAGDWAKKPWRFFDAQSPYVSTVSKAQRQKALRQIDRVTAEKNR
jgi:DNA-3-methyladenine glycosylase